MKLTLRLKGGVGSGHWGRAGRPGKRGGSLAANVAMSRTTGRYAAENRVDAILRASGGKGTVTHPDIIQPTVKTVNLNPNMDDDEAYDKFTDVLHEQYPNGLPIFHEAPGDVKQSMEENGIWSDYGVFATVGKPSNFVYSDVKTSVYAVIPPSYYSDLGPDMRYNGALDLLREHKGVVGADVSFRDDVPPEWIREVKVVRGGVTK